MKTQFPHLIIGNELDSDGWALIAPYGEHPKSRTTRVNGAMVNQKFLQVLDNGSADKLMDKESGLFRTLRRAIVGIPVYGGHPDLKDHSPETLGNAGRKIVIGAIDQVRKSAAGIEAHFVLTPDGATAVENGAKFPSALWLVLPNGETKNGAAVCHPFKLLSVGLTDRPNISGVESLANQQDKENPMLKEMIMGALIGRGAELSNDCTDQQIIQVIANGDFPGHPFRGNQYAGGGESGPSTASHSGASGASQHAHAASGFASRAGTKEAHLFAAAAHRHAAAKQNEAGNKPVALYHDMMAKMHSDAAATSTNK